MVYLLPGLMPAQSSQRQFEKPFELDFWNIHVILCKRKRNTVTNVWTLVDAKYTNTVNMTEHVSGITDVKW